MVYSYATSLTAGAEGTQLPVQRNEAACVGTVNVAIV
jgi:hypothetical protein